jgi:uncharacterized iron-regulated protein
MKTQGWFLSLALMGILVSFRSDKPAYRIFNSEGKEVGYDKMLRTLQDADMVFFGELHDNPIAHWLEYEVTHDLYATKKNNLVLAAEMFETDNQRLIDEYLGGMVNDARFEEEAKLWKNYTTDYKPLLKFALDNKLTFVASNVPRRYAAMVSKGGFEALDGLAPEAKVLIAPLPIGYDPELKCYKDMLQMGHSGGMAANENFPKAQALKDATMAHFLLKYYSPGKCLIHYNGSYHTDWHQGIVWYVSKQKPELKILTIATVMQDNITEIDSAYVGQADYVIVVPTSMTRTY